MKGGSDGGGRAATAEELVKRHGELMSGPELRRALAYASERSFYRAVAAAATPVPVFKIEGRAAWFAKTREVAAWLSDLGRKGS